MKAEGDKAVLTFKEVGDGLRTVDAKGVLGFAICGADKKWVWADVTITGKGTITASHKDVAQPVAVRYAWADNPVCNAYSTADLPLTPFRTDDFPVVTAGK